jgi:hypothetical protein
MSDSTSRRWNLRQRAISFLAIFGFLTLLACGQKKQVEKIFPTPDDAVVALVDAVKTDNTSEMSAILGPEARIALASGDDVADRRGRDLFVAAYYEQASLSGNDNTRTLFVGDEEWPFPIPVVKEGNSWRFDTASGIDELRYRRIGENELATIDACRSYYSAQNEYARTVHDGDPIGTYAQKFMSSAGKHDGLYWDAEEGEDPSPLGDLAAEAEIEGYSTPGDKPTPFRGYYFRILTAQGADAPGGARNYISQDGLMKGGFALVALPAEYGKGGVMTFMVNQDGVVYQKDLGTDTSKIVGQIKEFNPDFSWQNVQ